MWSQEQKQLANQACHEWSGTRHVNRIAVKGEGVDCVRFVAEILVAAGIIERPEFPRYDERLGVLRKHNIIEDILLQHLHAERIEPADGAQFGDIVVCSVGRQTNHVGIIAGDDLAMWHAPAKGSVGPANWIEWMPRTQSLVRLTAPGYRKVPALKWDEIQKMLPS